MHLGPPVQIAYAVADIDAAVPTWVALGAGPFFVLEHIALRASRIFGEPGAFDHSSAYGQWGSIMVELVQDHTAGATPVPALGLHHLAFFVHDLASASAAQTAAGRPEALWAETANGQQFVFHDGRHDLGHFVELYEPSDGLRAFYALVADAAAGWDGSQPRRAVPGRGSVPT